VKEGQFEKAKLELEKAKKIDPTNVYIAAFKDRINYFEQQKKKGKLEAAHEKGGGPEQAETRNVVNREESIRVAKLQKKTEGEWHEHIQTHGTDVGVHHVEEKGVRQAEKVPSKLREDLLRKVEDEMQTIADERHRIEKRQQQLDDKLKTLHEEVLLLEDRTKKVVEQELRKLLDEERKKISDDLKLGAEQELLRLKEELLKKTGEEAIDRLEQEFEAWKETVAHRQVEHKRAYEELALRVDRELLGLREELQKKADGVAVRKLQQEFQTWKESDKELKQGLLQKVEEEVQKIAAERLQTEQKQQQLDEKLKSLHKEVQHIEGHSRKVIEEGMRNLLEDERKKTSDEFKLRAERELLRLKEELLKKTDEGTIKKLEREFQAWKESAAKRQEEQTRKEAEGRVKAEAQAKKVREFIGRAREFRSLKQYNEAFAELRQVYVLDPTFEEAHRLEAEIRGEEAEEKKTQIEQKLAEMSSQIQELSRALEHEKRAREEMNKMSVKRTLAQYRSALEKAWLNGAPDATTVNELHNLALSLSIPEVVEQSIKREVKLEMYAHAVKEAIAKRHLVRSSSSTLEWLRKVYEITLDEYLEYESKFLVDLVADQYKGSILLVSNDEETKATVITKLKSSGYAIVAASTPEEALEKIEKLFPNFIFCEMEFSSGSLSGIKFLHILRTNSKYSYLPFILFCNPQHMHEIPSSDLRPNEGLLEKPVDMDSLLEMMNIKLQAFRDYVSSIS
jgi:CheY-like chemotaxis protein